MTWFCHQAKDCIRIVDMETLGISITNNGEYFLIVEDHHLHGTRFEAVLRLESDQLRCKEVLPRSIIWWILTLA